MACLGPANAARAQAAAAAPGQPITQAQVNQAFGLISSELATLDVPAFHDGSLRVTVPFEGVEYELSLNPHSNRSDRYEVRVHDADGKVRRDRTNKAALLVGMSLRRRTRLHEGDVKTGLVALRRCMWRR
jgi:hypothetical protein